MNDQFLSRNQNELVKVITTFRELLEVFPHEICLYLDKENWEVFSPTFGITILTSKFKHLNTFVQDMRQLRQDIINVGCMKYHHNIPSSQSETWSLKRMNKIFNEQQIKTFL